MSRIAYERIVEFSRNILKKCGISDSDALQTIEEYGARLLEATLAVASGGPTKAKELGDQELFIVSRNHPRQ
jgi:hypothetical protein